MSSMLAFGACDTKLCTDITIVEDMVVELTESFDVTLERSPSLDDGITFSPADGEVEIIDNDGVLTMSLNRNYYVYLWMY